MLDPLSLALLRRSGNHGPLVLMYHSIAVGACKRGWPWQLSLRHFVAHLDMLCSEGWRTLTVADIVAELPRPPGREVVITFDDGYADNFRACEELARRKMRATCFVVAGSVNTAPAWQEAGRPALSMLSAEALRGLVELGIEIGSHAYEHRRLSALDNTALSGSLVRSREYLEELTGRKVTSLAYPYGVHNERVVRAARLAGYLAACTTDSGWALRDGDPWRIRRLTVLNGDSAAVVARKLAFAGNNASWSRTCRYLWKRLGARR